MVSQQKAIGALGLIKGAIGAAAKANGAYRNSLLELVKTSGSSHCGEHSAAIKIEESNPSNKR